MKSSKRQLLSPLHFQDSLQQRYQHILHQLGTLNRASASPPPPQATPASSSQSPSPPTGDPDGADLRRALGTLVTTRVAFLNLHVRLGLVGHPGFLCREDTMGIIVRECVVHTMDG